MILSNDPDAAGFIADLRKWKRPLPQTKPRLKELQLWLLSWYRLHDLDVIMANFGPERRGFWNWRQGFAPPAVGASHRRRA